MQRKIKTIILAIFLALSLMPFVIALSSSTETIFSMQFSKSYCESSTNNVGWWENMGEFYSFVPWTTPDYNCYKSEVEYGLNECCPVGLGFNCNRINGKCEATGVLLCENFPTAEECSDNNNHEDIADFELKDANADCNTESQYDASNSCMYNINCLCSWNKTACKPVSNKTIRKDLVYYSLTNPGLESICEADTPPETGGLCEYTFSVIDKCNITNKRFTSWQVSWTGEKPENCEDGEKTSPCLGSTLIDFFNFTNAAIAIIILIIFYLIVYQKHKGHHS